MPEKPSRGYAAISVVVMPDVSHFRNAEHREVLLSGLRLALGD